MFSVVLLDCLVKFACDISRAEHFLYGKVLGNRFNFCSRYGAYINSVLIFRQFMAPKFANLLE